VLRRTLVAFDQEGRIYLWPIMQQFVLDLEPKYIPPLTDFYVRLHVRRGTKFKSPLRIWCTFEGFEDLPVQ